MISNKLKHTFSDRWKEKGNIWASNRYQWSQRWSMASLLHPFCYPFSQPPVLRFVKDWRWLEYMQYGFVSVYRFWSDGLRAREITGQVFWSFDIRHLLDLVKWYSHIEGMAERLRIHVFDRWLFQKMHSELAASARTCVLGPNRPDVRNYKLCLKSQVKDFLCLQNVPSETRFQNLLLFWWSFSHSTIIQSSIHICDPSHTFKICRATLAPWFQGR